MPELPDVELYLFALDRLLTGHHLQKIVVKSPFLLRTFEPSTDDVVHRRVLGFSRIGKRIVWRLEDDLYLVFHLMIAGRYHWRKPDRMPAQKIDLSAVQFQHGTMMLTEASQKKRASLHILRGNAGLAAFDRGGMEILNGCLAEFSSRLTSENRTLKRALTDPTKFSGIGNAYSDEILLTAGLSPLQRTRSLNESQIKKLFESVQQTMLLWIERLRDQAANGFPEKVRAMHPEMLAHGKFGEPCQVCGAPIQRIRYADNECNYCPGCQTGGKILADRSLSRLLKDEWPRTLEQLEGGDD